MKNFNYLKYMPSIFKSKKFWFDKATAVQLWLQFKFNFKGVPGVLVNHNVESSIQPITPPLNQSNSVRT